MNCKSKIKLAVAMVLGAMLLSGCEWHSATGIERASVAGFEDCTVGELSLNDSNRTKVYAVRCHNSQTTTQYTRSVGKSHITNRVVVIDGVKYVAEGAAKR